jgi:hypothetical protein
LIASIVQANNARLITRNLRHFEQPPARGLVSLKCIQVSTPRPAICYPTVCSMSDVRPSGCERSRRAVRRQPSGWLFTVTHGTLRPYVVYVAMACARMLRGTGSYLLRGRARRARHKGRRLEFSRKPSAGFGRAATAGPRRMLRGCVAYVAGATRGADSMTPWARLQP